MDQVLGWVGAAVANPVVQYVALVVAGWALTVSWQVAARWLRWRGQRDVDAAKAAVEAAKATPNGHDDAAAQKQLSAAEQEQAVLVALADAIDRHTPGSVLAKLVKVPGSLPPAVLEVLKALPSAVAAVKDVPPTKDPPA